MGFTALVNAYTMRICLSVAITKMVKPIPEIETTEVVCEPPDESHDVVIDEKYTYDWSEQLQGIILAAFYFGYVVTHIPGGIIAEKFGGKYVLGIGILLTALFTLITPFVIDVGE